MPSQHSRVFGQQQQPKLRTSCDACGAAKVKCDRAQPECERCVSHNIPCVYGVSRKMGKPPRERLRQSPEQTSNGPDGLGENKRSKGSGDSGDTSISTSSSLAAGHVPLAWDHVNDSSMVNLDPWPSLPEPHNFDFGVGDFTFPDTSTSNTSRTNNVDFGPLATPFSATGMDTHPSIEPPAPQLAPSHSRSDSSHPDAVSLSDVTMADNGCCNCPIQANEIFTSLYCLNLGTSSFAPSMATSSASSGSSLDRVPLDHVLRLNRDASERLGCLIECPCADSPHLALLYASIISRVLVWYQQAAGCGGQSSSSRTSSTPSTAASSGTSSWSLTPSTGLSVTPAKMAVGNFDVDDLRIESALKMQLLAGEMKRAGRLVDKFTSHYSSGHGLTEESFLGGADSLYSKLDSWLRREHVRIDDMIRSRLRELNS